MFQTPRVPEPTMEEEEETCKTTFPKKQKEKTLVAVDIEEGGCMWYLMETTPDVTRRIKERMDELSTGESGRLLCALIGLGRINSWNDIIYEMDVCTIRKLLVDDPLEFDHKVHLEDFSIVNLSDFKKPINQSLEELYPIRVVTWTGYC